MTKRAYQPKTGAKCSCRRGMQRDNCSTCEGTGYVIDFVQIRRDMCARIGHAWHATMVCLNCGTTNTRDAVEG